MNIPPVKDMKILCSYHHAVFSPMWERHSAKIDNEKCEECAWRKSSEGADFMNKFKKSLFGDNK